MWKPGQLDLYDSPNHGVKTQCFRIYIYIYIYIRRVPRCIPPAKLMVFRIYIYTRVDPSLYSDVQCGSKRDVDPASMLGPKNIPKLSQHYSKQIQTLSQNDPKITPNGLPERPIRPPVHPQWAPKHPTRPPVGPQSAPINPNELP